MSRKQISRHARAEPGANAERADGEQFGKGLVVVVGVDLSLYKTNTLRRRIRRRMILNKLDGPDEYAKYLREHAMELENLYQDILIPVQIFATDLNQRGVEIARAGLCSKNITEDVSPERLRRFFTEAEGGYRVSKPLRDMCVFARQNIIADPPFSRMDLISCRNLLIYLEPVLQKQVLPPARQPPDADPDVGRPATHPSLHAGGGKAAEPDPDRRRTSHRRSQAQSRLPRPEAPDR